MKPQTEARNFDSSDIIQMHQVVYRSCQNAGDDFNQAQEFTSKVVDFALNLRREAHGKKSRTAENTENFEQPTNFISQICRLTGLSETDKEIFERLGKRNPNISASSAKGNRIKTREHAPAGPNDRLDDRNMFEAPLNMQSNDYPTLDASLRSPQVQASSTAQLTGGQDIAESRIRTSKEVTKQITFKYVNEKLVPEEEVHTEKEIEEVTMTTKPSKKSHEQAANDGTHLLPNSQAR